MSAPLVVIPAFNEAQNLPDVLRELATLSYPIILVDDGSSDETSQVAAHLDVEVLRLSVNQGVGAALRAGFRFAVDRGYSSVVQVDADGQHPVHQIADLVSAAEKTKAHLVIGSRYRSPEATLQPSFIRRLPMRVMSLLVSRAAGTEITDATSGFRIVCEPLLSEFAREFPTYFLGDTYEVTLAAARSGYQVTEIPAALNNRKHGESRTTVVNAVVLTFKALFTTIFRLHPGVRPIRPENPHTQ